MLEKITITDSKLAETKKIVGRKPAKLSAIQVFKNKTANLKKSIQNEIETKKNVVETPDVETQKMPETKPSENKEAVTTQHVIPNNVVNFPDSSECEKRLANKGVICTKKASINKLISSRKLRVAAKVIEFTKNVNNNVQKVELSLNQSKEEIKEEKNNIYDFSKSFAEMRPVEPKQEEIPAVEKTEEKPYSWLRNEETAIAKNVKEETKEDSNVVEFQTLMEQKATTADSLATQKEILMNLRKQVEQNNALCEARKRELIEENMALTQELNDVLAEINQLSDTVSQQEAFLGIADEEIKGKIA